MQRFWVMAGAIIFVLLWAVPVKAETAAGPPTRVLDSVDFRAFEQYKAMIDGELGTDLDTMSVKEFALRFVRGKVDINPVNLVRRLADYLVREVKTNAGLLAKLILLAVVSSLLINMQNSFGSETVARIASLACFLALAAIALGSFRSMLQMGMTTVGNMADFMTASLPQMALLVTGMGHAASAAMIFPVLVGMTGVFASAVERVIFPLITISAILSLADTISETVSVKNLADLTRSLALFILGFLMTVFVGVLTMRAVYGSVLDGLALKTTQLVTGSFPVVGSFLSDALGVTLGYVALLKQAIGLVGILMVLGISLFPILKIAAIVLVYKVAAAVVEPLGDQRTADVLEVFGDHLTYILGTVAVVALMFIIMISIVALTANQVILAR